MAGGSDKIEKRDPVKVVKKYMEKLVERVGNNPNQILFPVLTGKGAMRQPASYGAVRSQFKDWVQRAGLSDEVQMIIKMMRLGLIDER